MPDAGRIYLQSGKSQKSGRIEKAGKGGQYAKIL